MKAQTQFDRGLIQLDDELAHVPNGQLQNAAWLFHVGDEQVQDDALEALVESELIQVLYGQSQIYVEET